MGRKRERWFPPVLAILAPGIYFGGWALFNHAPSSLSLSNLTKGILDLADILVGFLATSKALLYAIPDRRAIKFLREAGALSDLADYLFVDVMVWLFTAISALVLVFLDPDIMLPIQRIVVGVWLFLPMWGVLGFIRSMYIFAKFLKLSSKSPDASEAGT